MAVGLGRGPEYVSVNGRGVFIDVNNGRGKALAKAVEKAEFRKIRIHDGRHIYATLRISKGDNIAGVSKQLGHHSVMLTMDVYYYWMAGNKKSEVVAMDNVIEEKVANQG